MPGTQETSATFFFITDQRSVDRTQAAPAARSSLSTTGDSKKIVYRAPRRQGSLRASR
ncbi:MAG: hypothetical protein ACYC8T_33055 [Myxococcaceae bacterium]